MNATVHSSTPPAQAASRKDRSRFWSILCAALFAPAALASGMLTLASERASHCLTYGEQCTPGLPDWLFNFSLGLGVVACFIALIASAARMRHMALTIQIFAECTALLVILSHA